MSFTLIDMQAKLEQMAERFAGGQIIAFDIECASNLHRYINRVCLIQMAVCSDVFVIDALCGESPFGSGAVKR